ncbi:MAG: hypothetical protein HYW63_00850 [Candidatus Levybacteria bacterium]|nr:hypothetical protein [Candidatus Levybacteria bacterium]
MFNFLSDLIYLILVGSISLLTIIVTKNSLSKKILAKDPKALLINNSLIIFGIILIIIVFIKYSWIAGITTITIALIIYIIIARILARALEKNLFESHKKEGQE